jgi:pimeloyl-ACP methyl ester carboxylesterase
MTKIAGSRYISQRHGSADPDPNPHQKVMDPQHCSQGYTVIAPDMLGHGFSSCPDKVGAYTFTKLFKDVITIFDAYIPDDAKVGF